PDLQGEALFAPVRQTSGATDKRYRAEAMIPTPTGENKPQNWLAPNFETLWDQPMEQNGSSYTVGDMAAFELNPGSEIYHQLEDLEKSFPVTQDPVSLLGISFGTL